MSHVAETIAITHLELMTGELYITSAMQGLAHLSQSTTTRAAMTPEMK